MQTQTIDLTRDALEAALEQIKSANLLVVGDICLDVYWDADMRLSELSRETPHHPLPIVQERFSPGGAGNVLNNAKELGPRRVAAIGVTGNDWRGDTLLKLLTAKGIDVQRVVRTDCAPTNAYIKPMLHGISDVVYESPRIDFEARCPLPTEVEEQVLDALRAEAERADAILVSDQLTYGCVTSRVREELCRLGAAGKPVLVDSRSRIGLYRNVIVKPNEVEATAALPDAGKLTHEEIALKLSGQNGKPAIVTLGGEGALIADGDTLVRVPACRVEPPIDFVGAGDTFLAACAACVASGCSPALAARIACYASAVTIKKLGTTGTAAPEEILNAFDLESSR